MRLLVILLLVVSGVFCGSELLSVVVIYRHGDRTPVRPYPTDPYRNASYWPVSWGQLTNIGKMQHYQLGKWLRSRYDSFLPRYSPSDFRIRSSDVDRTLMSAGANLAGFFPPIKSQIWEPDLSWQPIPVHTVPEVEDALVAMKRPCAKYSRLLAELFKTPFFVNVSHTNHDLYAYLTRYSGATISNLENLEYIYNTMTIERLYNFTLPDWALKVYPAKLKPWADLSFSTMCYTPQLARLKAGLLFNEVIEHFKNVTQAGGSPKFKVYSGHDTTISNVLQTMGVFSLHSPPYASTIIFELRRNPTNDFINVFYKNSSDLQEMTLPTCQFNCDFGDFVRILAPVTLNQQEWESECRLSIFEFLGLLDFEYLILGVLLLGVVVTILAILLVVRYKGKQEGGVTVYMQLPNDDEVA